MFGVLDMHFFSGPHAFCSLLNENVFGNAQVVQTSCNPQSRRSSPSWTNAEVGGNEPAAIDYSSRLALRRKLELQYTSKRMCQKGTQILMQESLANKNRTHLATAIEAVGRKMVLSICRPCSTWRSMGRCTVLYPPRCKPWSSSGLVGGFLAPTLVDHMDSSEATTAWLSEMHCCHQHCGGVRGVKVIMVWLHLLFGCVCFSFRSILWMSRSSQNLGRHPLLLQQFGKTSQIRIFVWPNFTETHGISCCFSRHPWRLMAFSSWLILGCPRFGPLKELGWKLGENWSCFGESGTL